MDIAWSDLRLDIHLEQRFQPFEFLPDGRRRDAPGSYVDPFRCSIRIVDPNAGDAEWEAVSWEDGEEPETIEIGQILGHLLRLDWSFHHGYADDEIFGELPDSISYIGALCDEESGEVRDDLFEIGSNVFLTIDRVTLEPEYRGAQLSLYAVATVIRQLGQDGRVVLIPGPLGSSDRTSEEIDAATEKLARHWERLSFARVGESDVWAIDLQTTSFRHAYDDLSRAAETDC